MAIAEAFPPDEQFAGPDALPALPEIPEPLRQLAEWAEMPNVAFEIDEGEASRIAARVIDEYDIDKSSRSDWEAEARDAMDAVLQKTEAKAVPWPNAANIKFPLLTTAALQFGARSYPAIVQGDRVVRVKTIGPDPYGLKQERADRVALHMSHQLLEEQDGWETDLDIMLHQLPIIGHGYKKVYREHATGVNVSEFASAMNIVVNQTTKDIRRVPRITEELELYPDEIEERVRDERFVPFEYGAASADEAAEIDRDAAARQGDDDAAHLFLVQYRYWDLDGDGLREPWIATVHKATGKLVRLQANYDLETARLSQDQQQIIKLPRYHYFVGFPFVPDPNGGYHGIGFGRLLKSIGETVNSSLNQMLDAATLQNQGGGFIGSGMNVKKSKIAVRMNEWTVLNVPGQKIRDAMVAHDFKGPSPVLFQLLGLMIDAGKQIASVQEVLTGDTGARTMQPTTLLALIEQGLKVFTAIIKRVFRSLKREFELLYELNRRYPDEQAYAEIIDWEPDEELLQQIEQLQQQAMMGHNGGPPMDEGGQGQPMPGPGGAGAAPQGAMPGAGGAPPQPLQIPPEIMMRLQPPSMAADYDARDRNVVPVADPNAVTDMQALAKAQVIWSAIEHPSLNGAEALRRYFQAANIEDLDALIQADQGPDPMAIEAAKVELRGKNAKAVKDIAAANKMKVEAKAKEAEIGKTQAVTAKTAIEAEEKRQVVAKEYAEMASGAVDDDRHMEQALKEAQIRKLAAEERAAAKVEKAEGKSE
jgi:chaperonin GroES